MGIYTFIHNNLGLGKYATYIPPPPTLPEYDPAKDAPRWNMYKAIMQAYDMPEYIVKNKTPVGVVPKSDDEPDWRGIVRSKVNALPPPTVIRQRQGADEKYMWFDTPDYADIDRKLWWLIKKSICAAMFYTSTRQLIFRRPTDVRANHYSLAPARIAVLEAIPVALVLIGTGAAVMVAASLRGNKDDVNNYYIGGLVGTLCVAGLYKSHVTWVQAMCTLLPMTVLFKVNAEKNGAIFPTWAISFMQGTSVRPTGEDGFWSQDFRLYHYRVDPGRDVREHR